MAPSLGLAGLLPLCPRLVLFCARWPRWAAAHRCEQWVYRDAVGYIPSSPTIYSSLRPIASLRRTESRRLGRVEVEGVGKQPFTTRRPFTAALCPSAAVSLVVFDHDVRRIHLPLNYGVVNSLRHEVRNLGTSLEKELRVEVYTR